jgi:nucleotide-binding universal stress UspA family protein
MAWLSRILAPVAFSPRCRNAVQYAEKLACDFHSELILLHVVSPPVGIFSSPEVPAFSAVRELTEERLEQAKAALANYLNGSQCDFPVARELLIGDPAHVIVECARDRGAEMIVMATHGYGPFRRFLLGSVTAKVLHDASCPVWTGPHLEPAPADRKISFHRIVCAVDLAGGSRAVLEWGWQFARRFGAELLVLNVLPHTLVQLGGIYFDAAWREHAADVARQEACRLLQEVGAAGEVLIEIGEPPAAVREVAATRKADLLVIGRGQEDGLMGRLRANAYAILRESPCPVVTV